MLEIRLDEGSRPLAILAGLAEFVAEEARAAYQGPDKLPSPFSHRRVGADIGPVEIPLPKTPRLLGERSPSEYRRQIAPVQRRAVRLWHSGQREKRRHPVGEVREIVRHGVGGDRSRPPENHRHSDTALVDPPFAAPQARVESLVESRLALFQHVRRIEERRSVVAGERDERVVGQAEAVERVHHPADAGIHPLDHGVCRRDDPIEALVPVGRDLLVGRLERRVRSAEGQVQEERSIGIAFDEAHSFGCEQVCQVLAVGRGGTVVATQVIPVVVGPAAAEARELCEASCVGLEAAVEGSVVPLPDQARGVPRRLKRVGDRHFAQGDAIQTVNLVLRDRPRAMRVTARQQGRPSGSANRRRRIVLAKASALAGEPVQVRRAHRSVTEATEVAVTHVVGHDQNHVRAAGTHRIAGTAEHAIGASRYDTETDFRDLDHVERSH